MIRVTREGVLETVSVWNVSIHRLSIKHVILDGVESMCFCVKQEMLWKYRNSNTTAVTSMVNVPSLSTSNTCICHHPRV